MQIKFGKSLLQYSAHSVTPFVWYIGKKEILIFAFAFMDVKLDLMGVWEENVKKIFFFHKMDAVTRTWKNFHTEKMIIFYSLPNMFPPVQTGPGAHPAYCKISTGSFRG